MFVLNVADGTQVVAPVLIAGTSENQDFNAHMRKQRSALVETNVNGVKTVLGCAGTIFETGAGAAGFCFAFDVASNKQSEIVALTAGEGAGVWMAGQGIAADPQGSLYAITGNGDFDGASQFGEFLKLKYTPASGGNAATRSLAIPGQIVAFAPEQRRLARVNFSGVQRNVNVGLLEADEFKPGDWILIHVGFALSEIDEEQARDQLRLLCALGDDQLAI
jgi:hydrogenase assembly chaperone HypC/HupF